MGFDLLPIFEGALVTIAVFVCSAILTTVVAVAFGLMRLSDSWLVRWFAIVDIEFFRGTSLLVQMFWVFFALPLLGIRLDPFTAGVLILGLNYGAYGAVLVYGAVRAVPKGQYEASIAVNFSPATRMRRVILPQAAVSVLPPWHNLMIELLKGTSLVSFITLKDLTFNAKQLITATYETIQILAIVLAIYYALARLVVTPTLRYLENRLSRYKRRDIQTAKASASEGDAAESAADDASRPSGAPAT